LTKLEFWQKHLETGQYKKSRVIHHKDWGGPAMTHAEKGAGKEITNQSHECHDG
jgi:hypothetical protein